MRTIGQRGLTEIMKAHIPPARTSNIQYIIPICYKFICIEGKYKYVNLIMYIFYVLYKIINSKISYKLYRFADHTKITWFYFEILSPELYICVILLLIFSGVTNMLFLTVICVATNYIAVLESYSRISYF